MLRHFFTKCSDTCVVRSNKTISIRYPSMFFSSFRETELFLKILFFQKGYSCCLLYLGSLNRTH